MVLLGNGFQIGDYGISRNANGLYGIQEAFGCDGFPKNPPKKWFLPTFPYLGNLGKPPCPLCIPYRWGNKLSNFLPWALFGPRPKNGPKISHGLPVSHGFARVVGVVGVVGVGVGVGVVGVSVSVSVSVVATTTTTAAQRL